MLSGGLIIVISNIETHGGLLITLWVADAHGSIFLLYWLFGLCYDGKVRVWGGHEPLPSWPPVRITCVMRLLFALHFS